MIALSVLVLAVGLSMDAMAVAAARGLTVERASVRDALVTATWFGGFQAGMPMIGWLAGERLGPLISAWDHWLAFGLLTAIGGKMLLDARAEPRAGEAAPARPFAPAAMAPLAVATSIDALAAGIAIPSLAVPPLVTIATIGVTTASLSFFAVRAARRLGDRVGGRLEAIGGIVLVGLGVKILVEHVWA